MKYKVGDKVKIREDLKFSTYYGSKAVSYAMTEYNGTICTIDKIIDDDSFKIKEDDGKWSWTEEMFEELNPIDLVESGMRVTTRDGSKYYVIHKYKDEIVLQTYYNSIIIRYYTNQLIDKYENKDKDIVIIEKLPPCPFNELFRISPNKTILNRKPEPKEMTVADIEKELGYSIKIIK